MSFADALAQAGEEPDDAGADLGEHFDSDEWDESPKPPTAESADPDVSDEPGGESAQAVGGEEPGEVADASTEPTEPIGESTETTE